MRTLTPLSILLPAAALLLASGASAQTIGCEVGGGGGLIPTSGTGGGQAAGQLPPFELIAPLTVTTLPGGATSVTEIKLFGLTHTFAGDVMFVLEDPAGTKHMVLNRQGSSCDFSGDYVIIDSSPVPGGNTPLPACSGGFLPPSTFSQSFGTWSSGTNSIVNTPLGSIAPQLGTWNLYVYDWASGDVGGLTSWDLCFGTSTPPPPPPPPAGPACNGSELMTTYVAGNGGSLGGQVFFDLTVSNPAGVTIAQMDTNTNIAVGNNFVMAVYVCPTTYVGNTNTPGAWTFQSWGSGVAAGANLPSVVELEDFVLAPGTYGVTLVMNSAGSFRYTNGNGTNENYSNADIALTLGAAQNVPWTGTAFTPRVWNGTVRYDCGAAVPTNYCTAKVTSGGCVPAIAFSGTPSPSGNYVLSCSQVEPSQLGVLFYGLNGPAATPFQDGFLCVAPPVIRMPFQGSGGGALCTGTYSQAMTTVISSLSPGQTLNSQFWFRDPGVTSGTGLSDANECVVQ